jgi:hypothetical protein
MFKKTFISKFNLIDNTNHYPLTLNENIKLKSNKFTKNLSLSKHILKKRHSQGKISFFPTKSKLTFNKSFFGNKQQQLNNPKLRLLNIDKKGNFETKLKRISNINLKGNKKIQHFSQVKNNQSEYINKKLNDNLLEFNDIEQIIKNKKEDTPNEELEELDIDVNQLMEKINKEFSDIGKLIRVNFIVNNENEKENKYIYDKNEHVLLKIIANDLNENQGINAKEFFYNNQKLNMFKSLKDNNIKNNSIIKIVV